MFLYFVHEELILFYFAVTGKHGASFFPLCILVIVGSLYLFDVSLSSGNQW